jgi:hypothetical protein
VSLLPQAKQRPENPGVFVLAQVVQEQKLEKSVYKLVYQPMEVEA